MFELISRKRYRYRTHPQCQFHERQETNKLLTDRAQKIRSRGKINQAALGNRGNGVKGQIASQSTKRHSQTPEGPGL